MSEQAKKLIMLGVAPAIAEKLVKAGLGLPVQIKQAKTADLTAAGLTTAERTAVRSKFQEVK